MKSLIDNDIKKLSMGVSGVYTSKRKLMRIAVCIISIFLVVSLVFFSVEKYISSLEKQSVIQDEKWEGNLIMIFKSYYGFENIYPDRYLSYFAEAFDMTNDTFEIEANMHFYYYLDEEAVELVSKLYNGEKNTADLQYQLLVYFLVLDKNHNLIAEGTNKNRIIQALKDNGFAMAKEGE